MPLGFEDAGQQLGADRIPLAILQRAADVAPEAGWFGRVKQWTPFRRGTAVTFPAQTRMIDVFRHPDVSGRLLILGSPGAGKTTTLLELARELMAEAKADESKPLPHLFEMAGWAVGQSLCAYLAAELKRMHNLDEAVGRGLLASGRVLPLLDGLDELRDLGRIQAGMAAINEFLGDAYGQRDAVVCCRIRDYELAQGQLTALNGAVQLQPLTDGAIQAHLQALGKEHLWAVIQQNPALLEEDVQDGDLVMPPLLRTPLFLSIFATVNPTEAINGLAELWDGYIVQRLGIPAEQLSGNGYKRYQSGEVPSQKQTRYHLVFLAEQLVRTKPECLIEEMQPEWLTGNTQKWKMRLIGGLIGGLIEGCKTTLKVRSEPNQGIKASAKNMAILMPICLILWGIIQIKLMPYLQGSMTAGQFQRFPGAIAGAIAYFVFLFAGGQACAQHLALRLTLFTSRQKPNEPETRCIPWDYARFLSYAADRRLLQQTGGSYRFIHRSLLEHFARMD